MVSLFRKQMVSVTARIGGQNVTFHYATKAQANAAIMELKRLGIPANR